jgi:hypothetical protein
VVVHPHKRQITPDADGRLWNDFATPAVADAAARAGVTFLAARDGLVAASDGDPAGLYWPGDMHFNYRGIAVYGGVVAEVLGPMIVK